MLYSWRHLLERGFLSSWVPMERDDSRPADNFHGAFIPEVARYFVERLATDDPDFWVWDPMAGSGTTGMVCGESGVHYLLTDLNPVDPDFTPRPEIHQADAFSVRIVKGGGLPVIRRDLTERSRFTDSVGYLDVREELDTLEPFLFDLIIWHPPYSNIIRFSEDDRDLSNVADHETFIERFELAAYNIVRHLKPSGYLGLVIGDVWTVGKAEVYPLGFKTMDTLLGVMSYGLGGYTPARLKAIAIKDIRGNRPGPGYHLRLSRLARWGANDFKHEYLFTLQMGERTRS